MTSNTNVQNELLKQLLQFQPSGNRSISQPANWLDDPDIHIPTWLDKYVNIITDGVRESSKEESEKKGVWVFLIGSPGGGKSSLCGQVIRKLNSDHSFRDGNRDDLDLTVLTELPYVIEIVANANKDKFASARFIQDASVAKEAYSENSDPVQDLIQELSNAFEKGISLIACTNRGIIEQLIDRCNGDNNHRGWYKQFKSCFQERGESSFNIKFDSSKSVCDSVDSHVVFLDNVSLLEFDATQNSCVAGDLVNTIVHSDGWEICNTCECRKICPFKANRDWLMDGERLDSFLLLLGRAEILSSQSIVFRELLSFVSLLFAGCSIDYGEGEHPCEWVHEHCDNWLPLFARRIYMVMFGAHAPTGLDDNQNVSNAQRMTFGRIKDIDTVKPEERAVLELLSRSEPPVSTDVGVERLLGKNGIITRSGPTYSRIPKEFAERWDHLVNARSNSANFQCDIEDKLFELIETVTRTYSENASQATDEILLFTRWAANVGLKIGALQDGFSKDGIAIDGFGKNLKKLKGGTLKGKEKVNFMETITNLLKENQDNVAVSNYLALAIDKKDDNLELKFQKNQSGFLNVGLEVSGQDFLLNGEQYHWLTQIKGGLITQSLPHAVVDALTQLKNRILTARNYGTAKKIELIIYDSKKEESCRIKVDGNEDYPDTYLD